MSCGDENDICSLDDETVSTETCGDNTNDNCDDESSLNLSDDCLQKLMQLLRNDREKTENDCARYSNDLPTDTSDQPFCDLTSKDYEDDLDNVDDSLMCHASGTNDESDDMLDTSALDDCVSDVDQDQENFQPDLEEVKQAEDEEECPSYSPTSEEDTAENDSSCDETSSEDVTDMNDSDNEGESVDMTDLCSQGTSECDLAFTEDKLDKLRSIKSELDDTLKDFLEKVRCINNEMNNLQKKLAKLLRDETKQNVEEVGVCPTFDEQEPTNARKKNRKRECSRHSHHVCSAKKSRRTGRNEYAKNTCEQNDDLNAGQTCPQYPDKDVAGSKRRLKNAYASSSKKRKHACDIDGEL